MGLTWFFFQILSIFFLFYLKDLLELYLCLYRGASPKSTISMRFLPVKEQFFPKKLTLPTLAPRNPPLQRTAGHPHVFPNWKYGQDQNIFASSKSNSVLKALSKSLNFSPNGQRSPPTRMFL